MTPSPMITTPSDNDPLIKLEKNIYKSNYFKSIKKIMAAHARNEAFAPARPLPVHISLLTHKRKILLIGTNTNSTHPMQAQFASNPLRIYAHAEIEVLKALPTLLHRDQVSPKDLAIYNLRLSGHNRIALAKPCQGCQDAINHFKITTVIYTDAQGNFKKL